jgi:hypothetical protein
MLLGETYRLWCIGSLHVGVNGKTSLTSESRNAFLSIQYLCSSNNKNNYALQKHVLYSREQLSITQ